MKVPALYLEVDLNVEAVVTLPLQSKCTMSRKEEQAMPQPDRLSNPGEGVELNRQIILQAYHLLLYSRS